MVVIGKYLIDSVVGRGRYGWVSRAKHLELGLSVAVKHAPWAAGEECKGGKEHVKCDHVKESLWQAALSLEASLLSKVSHPAIVSLLDIGKGSCGIWYICLEDLGNTSLDILVQEQGNPGLSESIFLSILKQTASGLLYLHNADILHRDVKPENIMVMKTDKILKVKIIDLGLAIKWTPDKPLNTSEFRAGTINYMAPELMKPNTLYGNQIDVFSLGSSLYFVLFGEPPFHEFTRNKIRSTTAIFGLQVYHQELLETLSTEASLLLRSLLWLDPVKRITLSALCIN